MKRLKLSLKRIFLIFTIPIVFVFRILYFFSYSLIYPAYFFFHWVTGGKKEFEEWEDYPFFMAWDTCEKWANFILKNENSKKNK